MTRSPKGEAGRARASRPKPRRKAAAGSKAGKTPSPEAESWWSRSAKSALRASLWPYREVAFGKSHLNLNLLRIFPNAGGVRIRATTIVDLPADHHVPKRHREDRKIFYLHGGGYVGGSPRTHRSLVSHMARALEAEAVCVDYRKAPRYPYPAALRDAEAAWLRWNQRYPEARHLIIGDSAGGGLALALAQRMRDTGGPAAAAVMLIAPWLDVGMANPGIPDIEAHDPMLKAEDLRHYGEQYAGGHDLDEPGISPLHGDPRGLPPMLIHVGTHDILYPDAEAYAAKASAAGADVTLEIWPRMMHVWHAAPMLPEARKAIRSIRAWVDRVAP